ncbi:hypothetical protein M413DRAFT_445144 [Hebeloma cylindrosporum]|uniref:Uncharacterized protein n=1 Tax=Hebeloma cylindrosporum TaxID=76867 RepID=A0A0C3CCG2_HEBCY|nr:hypothetical protein M413DRAFT_445144 [Hebeloma cylindrosporum h7]
MDPGKEEFPNLQPPQQDSPPVYIQHATPGYRYTPQMAMVPVAIVPAAVVGAQYQSEMYSQCARGDHQFTTKYGPCGIITAVCCFPIGLLCLFLDTERQCVRCGLRID